MSIHTSISEVRGDGVLVRGYMLTELMEKASFAEVVHLMLRGEMPGRKVARLVDAILVSAVDHGVDAPSIHVARAAASCGVPLSTAVATGVASIGTSHGGAGEACARLLQEALAEEADPPETGEAFARLASRIVQRSRDAGANLPGFGHRVYKTSDPRADTLFDLARRLGLLGNHSRLATAVVRELAEAAGKRLVLNVDGAQAALLSDLGYGWRQVQPLFIIGRSLGLCAHAAEEIGSGKPLGYLKSAVAISRYEGAPPRAVAALDPDDDARAAHGGIAGADARDACDACESDDAGGEGDARDAGETG